MRLLITGGDGFTGRHLAKAASEAGYEVYSLKADLTAADAVKAEVSAIAPSHVVHLAAISNLTHSDELALYQINLFGSLNLIKALLELSTPPQKVLLASSAQVYGDQSGGLISESICPRPKNHYALSKLAMEHMAFCHLDRLPIVVVRPFNYTGVGHDQKFVIPKIVSHFARKSNFIELGNLNVYREYNDVREVCAAYLELMLHGVSGEAYNVCSGRAVSLQNVLDLMAEISDWRPEVRVNPKFVRADDIQMLAGAPQKFESCTGYHMTREFSELLKWMYGAALNSSKAEHPF